MYLSFGTHLGYFIEFRDIVGSMPCFLQLLLDMYLFQEHTPLLTSIMRLSDLRTHSLGNTEAEACAGIQSS